MNKILIISDNIINENILNTFNKNSITYSIINSSNVEYKDENFIMLFDIDLNIPQKNIKNNLILYVENDITNNLQTQESNYNLFQKLNKFNIIVINNDSLLSKLCYLFPLMKNKFVNLNNLTNDFLSKKINEINEKNNSNLIKFKTATCTIIKDEQQYLEEWIRHNISLGFDEIWLYEDYDSTSHKEITDKYPQVKLNKLQDIKSKINSNKQTSTWNYFIYEYKYTFDWVAFIDIDEFIMFEEGWDLQKLLNEYKYEGGVYLYWQMYNANGHIDDPHTPIVTTYTEKCQTTKQDSERWHFKSIVNLKMDGQLFITNHECLYGIATNGLRSRNYVCFDKCWINHYFTRSWEEWCNRFIKRGDISPYCRSYLHFYECNPNLIDSEDLLLEKMEIYKKQHNAKTLAIYYIATSDYKKYFYDFIEHIHHFMPHLIKTVVVLSDGLEEFDGITLKGVNYIVRKIEHNHWPIVTLFKMTYIMKNKIDCDYACYLNGDAIFNPIYHSYYMFDFNKINVTKHFHYASEDMNWYTDFTKNMLLKYENKKSLAYIDNTDYTYVQGGFFFGKSDMIYDMCKEIDEMVKIDLKHNIIPIWHDESYLNKWVLSNQNKININQFLTETTPVFMIPFTINGNKRNIKPKTQY